MGLSTTRRAGVVALCLLTVGLLASLLMVLGQLSPASAAETGRVRGAIIGSQSGTPKVKLLWFARDWTYLGARKAYGGGYSLSLPPGTYHLQFVDQRPAYDVSKYAPSDITVKIRANDTTVAHVRMHRGSAITGTVRAGGKPAAGARLVAANVAEQSFETIANKRGEFAVGGLPPGSYSVFTYERSSSWVGKSLYLPGLKHGKVRNVAIALNRHAGGLLVDLYAGNGSLNKSIFVTAVSKRSGQFWTVRASHGTASFRGLFPGRYKLVVPGVGNYLGRTGSVRNGKVKPQRVAFGSFHLNRRGGWVTGTVVDREYPAYPLEGARVLLFDKAGTQVGEASSNAAGRFTFGGQLTTQGGLSVVAGPGLYSEYLGEGVHYCKFSRTRLGGISLTTGQGTAVGSVLLPHQPALEQDAVYCWPLDLAPRTP